MIIVEVLGGWFVLSVVVACLFGSMIRTADLESQSAAYAPVVPIRPGYGIPRTWARPAAELRPEARSIILRLPVAAHHGGR